MPGGANASEKSVEMSLSEKRPYLNPKSMSNHGLLGYI